MNRRTFLAAGAVSAVGLSGCLGLGGGSGGSKHKSEEGYDTKEQDGVYVPLAPLSDTHEWYKNDSAKFADARGRKQYTTSHIKGAALSTAPDGLSKDDPVASWSKDQKIVCYCGCPHHLSSMRAATLLNNGYTNVYVIDEGFWAWHEKGYPVSGENTSYTPPTYEINGLDAASIGGTAWARHLESGQMEATDIKEDGSYSLHLTFYDVTPESEIRIRTPDYEVSGTLSQLSSRVVKG